MWHYPVWLFAIFHLSKSYGYVIEGTVVMPPEAPTDWHVNTRINIAGDQFVGFVKADGNFEVTNVPSGSYIVEAINPVYYFQAREQLRTLDLLFNPNVLYVLVPLLLVVILTKLVNTNDPTVQKEMQQMNILNPQQQLPDMSEFLSSLSLFGGNTKKTTPTTVNKRKSSEKHRQITNSAGISESSSQYTTVGNTSSPTSSSSNSTTKRTTTKARKTE
ncbi:unnamed protein product [Schistosoma spindalis]|nr:unnamed protein product [Schistosoma spindale]